MGRGRLHGDGYLLRTLQYIVRPAGCWTTVSPPPLPSDLRECSIVPDVAVVGEAVVDVAWFPVLDILLDWVEGFLLVNLGRGMERARKAERKRAGSCGRVYVCVREGR